MKETRMKSILVYLYLLTTVLCLCQSQTKTDLLCRKWKMVGAKSFNQSYKSVVTQMAKVMKFYKDGTYEEIMFSLKAKKVWEFNNDSTMINFAMTEFNGTPTKDMSLKDSKPTDRILKLSKDSLIIGMESYHGPQKIFGHDDWYFVPATE